jgi:hypothetical protein
MIKFLHKVYVPTLDGLTGEDLKNAQFQEAQPLDKMSGPELLSLHNLVASNLGRTGTKRFSDNTAAQRRTWAILQEYDNDGPAEAPTEPEKAPAPAPTPTPAPPKDEGKKQPQKKRGMRFVFPAESEVKPVRADSARGKALALLSQKGGATFAEVQKATGWNEKQAYEGIRLLHYYSGYGLAQTDGPFDPDATKIWVHTGKK